MLTESTAVCNDGSSAGFYYKEGSDPKLWFIYLAGGDWCYDEASCAARALLPAVGNGGYNGTFHTSSSPWQPTCLKGGIFSEDSTAALKDANKIYIPYCTSDAHMGDRAASAATNGWHFRGAAVVRAVLAHAANTLKMGAHPDTRLVFGGGSAGGRGAMTHLDFVQAQLPSTIEVLGFLDSNMWLDVASHNTSFIGFGSQTQQAYSYANASSLVTEDCGLMYQGDMRWRCLFGQYRMPFLKTPYLVVAAQYDSWQLRFDVCDNLLGCDIPTEALPYVDLYGVLLQQYMLSNPPVAYANRSSVYSQACYNHHMSENSALYFDVKTSTGMSENDALVNFLAGHRGEKWVDQCQGYNCGSGC